MLKKVFAALTVGCLMMTFVSLTAWSASATEADFRYDFVSTDEVFIMEYTGTDRNLTLPEKLGGYAVTAVGEQAFYGNDTLVSLTVPGTVEWIHSNGFSDCWALQFALLQDGVKKLGDGAFAYCYELKRVVIPASVMAIGNGAFADCFALTDVFFGGSREQWEAIEKGDRNENLMAATVHFTAVTEPTATETATETALSSTATATVTNTSAREDETKHTASDLPVWGDANGDGLVNMKDVLAMRKFLAGMDMALTAAADVNGDSAVNMKDVLAMRRFLAGLDTAL